MDVVFTGLIESVGVVRDAAPWRDGLRLTIDDAIAAGAAIGESIAINGACLTVVATDAGGATFEVMPESLARTTLGGLRAGVRVNIERAMVADGRFGGHVVQGHVDTVGRVVARTEAGPWTVLRIAVPAPDAGLLVHKGSVTLAGISLTVSDLSPVPPVDADGDAWFEVSLIPTTLTDTTLGDAAVGEQCNVEYDILGKYVARQLAAHGVEREVGR